MVTSNIIATLIHYPDTPTIMAIDGQVYFDRWPFADPVNHNSPLQGLWGTNKAALCELDHIICDNYFTTTLIIMVFISII